MSIFINTHLNKFSTSSERMSRSITIGCSQGLAFSNLRKYGLHALNTTYIVKYSNVKEERDSMKGNEK